MPTKSSLKRDVQALFEIGPFRHLDRVWRQFLNPDVANCAEHTFRVAWIALTLAKYEKEDVDHEKLLKIALVHDLSESRTGDVHYMSRQYVERREKEAIRDIFEGTAHAAEMISLAEEYEERRSLEAKLVKDADNLDVQMELIELAFKGHSLGSVWNKTREKHVYPKIYTDAGRKFWEEIRNSNPHDWHLLSPQNRFNMGDWKKKK